MILGYNNYVDKGNVSSSSEASGYPISNIQDIQLKKIYRSVAIASLIDRGDCESTTAPMITGETVPSLSNTTFAQDSAVAHAGTYSYKITKTVATGTAAYADIVDAESTTDMHGLTAKNTYTFTVWVYIPSASGIALNEVALEFADYTTAWETSTSSNPTSFDTWQQLTVTRTIRVSATGVILRVFNNATTDSNEYFYIDDLALYAWEWIKTDIGSAEDVKSVFILGYNITSGAIIKIQGNSSDDWSSPPVDETMTFGDVIYKLFDTEVNYQYWRIAILDINNPDGYIEIGRVQVGPSLELGDIITAEFPITYERSDLVQFSITGQVFADKGYMHRLWTFALPHLNGTEKGQIDIVFDNVGRHTPLILIPYEDDISGQGIYYVVFNDNISYNHIFKDIWNCNIAFREVF